MWNRGLEQGPAAIAVGQHHQFVRNVLALAPGLHDEGIVDRHAGDFDALAAEVVEMSDEAGQVLLRARRSEGARHREKHDLAIGEQVAGIDGFHATADALQRYLGQPVASLNGHWVSSCGE